MRGLRTAVRGAREAGDAQEVRAREAVPVVLPALRKRLREGERFGTAQDGQARWGKGASATPG